MNFSIDRSASGGLSSAAAPPRALELLGERAAELREDLGLGLGRRAHLAERAEDLLELGVEDAVRRDQVRAVRRAVAPVVASA